MTTLLDSNVVISALVEDHPDHGESRAVFETSVSTRFVVAAHSYAEAFTALTRRGKLALASWDADEAWAALEQIAAATQLVGLTPAQAFDAIRVYATAGGTGPRLYDHLIGTAALYAGADTIVTWNSSHMRSLFPELAVRTPPEFIAMGTGTRPSI